MSGPKRNPDKLNSIGVVVVGICGAVLVYVSIVALQAFYMNDSSEIQNMQDYGGQDTTFKSIRTEQVGHLEVYAPNAAPPPPAKPGDPAGVQTYQVPIERAIKLVVESAKVDPSSLVPTQGRSDKATIQPIFGRPNLAPPAPSPSPSPAGTVPEGSGVVPGPADAAPAGAGSGSAAVSPPLVPTGGQGPGGGAPPGTHGEAIKGAGSNAPSAPVVPKEAKPPATTPAVPAIKDQPKPPAGGPPVAPKPAAQPPVAPKPAAQPPVVKPPGAPPAPKTGATQGSAAKGNGR